MIKILLLGTFRVVIEEDQKIREVAEKEWHTRQARQLLKILITERPRPVASELLIETFWPDSAPKAAATTLRSAINALRNVLEPDRARRARSKYIHTQAPGYAFRAHPDIWLDVAQFEQNLEEANTSDDPQTQRFLLTDAVSLYRDDFLSSDPYADWAGDERERLRERYFDALLQLATVEAGFGNYVQAIELCRRIFARDAIREKAFQALMRFQAGSGDSAGALLTYDRCRTVLLEELGADPSPKTQALHQQILDGNIDTALGAASSSIAATLSSVTQSQPPQDFPQIVQLPVLDTARLDIFVGRDDETARFMPKLDAALDGEGALLALIGEAGIGKTRFAYRLLQSAVEREATVLSAACHALEQQLPFAPLTHMLGRYLHELPVESIGQISPSGLSQFSRVYLPLRERLPDLPAPSATDPLNRDENLRQLVDGIASIFIDLARLRPLVLFVDDLHWSDSETIFVLSRLLHQSQDVPVCILVAYREGDATENSPLLTLQHAEHRVHPTHFLRLKRLSLEHIQSFVQQYFARKFSGGKKKKQSTETLSGRWAALAKFLYRITLGNALFVIESIKALDEFDEEKFERDALDVGEIDEALESAPTDPRAGYIGLPNAEADKPFEAEFSHRLSLRRNQRVQELILERIERLPDTAIIVLQNAAVIGRDFSTDLLELVVEDDPLAGLELLIARKFLIERSDDRLDFSHNVVRQVAYDTMSALHRRRIHQRIGDAMVQLGLAEKSPSEVAFQYRNAGRSARIPYARYSLLAGRKLLASYGVRQAISYFDDALFVLDTIPESDPNYDPKMIQQALIGRGLAAESLLDPETMLETYRRQQRWAHKQNNRTFLLTAQARFILMLALTGQQRESNELLKELIQFVVDDQDAARANRLELALDEDDISTALESSPVIVDLITRRRHIYSTADLTNVSNDEASKNGPATLIIEWTLYTPAAPMVDNAVEQLLKILPRAQAVLPLFDYGWILRIQGQLDESEQCLCTVIDLATEQSQNFIASTAYHQLAVATRMRGDMQKSYALNEKSIALNGRINGAPAELASLWPRIGSAFLDLRNGQVDRAERRLHRVLNFLQNRNSFRSHRNSTTIGLGEVALYRGDIAQASRLFDEALSDALNLYPYTYVRALLGQARIANSQGQPDVTVTNLKRALRFAGTRSLIEEYTETVVEIVRLQPSAALIDQLVKSTTGQLKQMGLRDAQRLLEEASS